jgi:uncharacterized protein YcbK (DUF882 family)
VRLRGLDSIVKSLRSRLALGISGIKWPALRSPGRYGQTAGLIAVSGLFGLYLYVLLPSSTESAIANGDTRTIRMYHAHTGESIEATYRVDGHYDPAVLQKLNWFLRDWRRNEETNMDPRLFDAVWDTYRSAGATQPIVVLCGYRSPQTNAMLRHRSRGVAEHSQHILGKAMDTTMPGMSMERIREMAMRLQMGGVGYYPSSNFVHIDVGGVRAWPRMSYDQLVRLFPDGKTVHVAADGRTLPGYEEARAEIEAGGGTTSGSPPQGKSFFAWLFGIGGGGEDEHEDTANTATASDAAPPAEPTRYSALAQDNSNVDDQSTGTIASALAGKTAPGADDKSADEAAPVPPPRPVDLALLADIPLPPTHSDTQLAMAPSAGAGAEVDPVYKDATGNPNALPAAPTLPTQTPDLPGIITQGPNDGSATQSLSGSASPPSQGDSETLAYAPMAQMEGLRSAARVKITAEASDGVAEDKHDTAIVPARLDGSNFRSVTAATETAEMDSQTIFGPTLAGLRRAARVETAALSSKLASSYLARFSVAATNLSTGQFSGPSVVAFDADKTRMVLVDSSAARQDGD